MMKQWLILIPLILIILGCDSKIFELADSSENGGAIPDIESGLVAYWELNRHVSGSVIDKMDSTRTSRIFGSMQADIESRSGLYFDGIDDYIEIDLKADDILSDLSTGSLSLWFKCRQFPTDFRILPVFHFGAGDPCMGASDAANQGFIVEVGHHPLHFNSQRLYYTAFDSTCLSPILCFDSGIDLLELSWYHFVVVFTPDGHSAYLNGIKMSTIRYNYGSPEMTNFFAHTPVKDKLWLGKGFWNGQANYFNGWIKQISVFEKALNPEQVSDLYRQNL